MTPLDKFNGFSAEIRSRKIVLNWDILGREGVEFEKVLFVNDVENEDVVSQILKHPASKFRRK